MHKMLLILLIVIIFCLLYYITYEHYEMFFFTTPQTTPHITPQTTISNIQAQLNNGYDTMNTHRFTKIDNQFTLDKLTNRVNNLLTTIHKTFNNIATPDTNPMTFY